MAALSHRRHASAGHPVTPAVLRAMIKEMLCNFTISICAL